MKFKIYGRFDKEKIPELGSEYYKYRWYNIKYDEEIDMFFFCSMVNIPILETEMSAFICYFEDS